MKKIGIWIDFGNICDDYNTVYLDRDNTDRETFACMTKVMQWFNAFVTELSTTFESGIYRMDHDALLGLSEMVRKRFFFYSLEKEIIAQTFILRSDTLKYTSLNEWAKGNDDSLVLQNDEGGEGISLYFTKDSKMHTWIKDRLKDFSWDEIPFENTLTT